MLKRRIFLGAVCLAASLAISPVFALADETSLEGESVGEASEKTVAVDAEADKGETAPVGGGVLVDGELADDVAGQSVDGEAPAEGVGGALEGDSGAAPGEGAVPGEGATPEDAAPEDASAVADAAEEAPAATLNAAAPVRALAAAPASEPLQDGAFYRIASAIDDNYVLDITGASQNDGTNVIVYQYNRQLNQFWRAESLGGGWYRFVSSLGDNLFLGYDPAATLLSNVRTSVSTGNDIRWQVVNQGTYFELIPSMNAAMRLDLNECDASNCQNIQLYSANGTPAQRFKFILMPGMTEAAASGEHIADGLYTIESALDSTMRVDVTGCGTADGTNVELWTSNTSDAQRFMVKSVGNGMYTLNSTCGNKSLDVAGGGTADGTNIQIWRPNNTIAQYWYFVKSGEGYSIRAIESQKALNVAGAASNGTNIDLSAANGSAGQRFVLASTQFIKDGLYVIQSALAAPIVLDVNGCSTEEGANVQTWRSNGTVAQRFRIVHVGSEVYNIINEASGLFVGITGDDLQNCANVAQWAGNGSDAQKWELCLAPDGSLMFKNVASGRFLDVYGCGTTRGTNVEIYDGNQTVAQRVFLKPGDWYMYAGVEGPGMRYIEYAEQFEGRAYQWGGRSPAQGFDCAGLVMYCANQVLGTSYDLIYTNAATLYTLCDPISESEARPGDLVFYRGTYGSSVNYISHVVIFCGNETMYGAGDPIKYAPVTSIRNIYGEPAKYMYARIR